MRLARRRFIAGSGAVALSGCATVPAAPDCSPLPRVQVDPARVVRSVAGLRPYRASGFVVRREALGNKALVHNYGHGGAGITLSWGSSRLATDLGLPGHRGPVAVIGSGVMGLTTARLAQEAGFPVTIYTAALPAATTSAVAGGQVSPFGHFREEAVTPEWMAQFRSAMAYSWQRFQTLLGPRYGVRWLPTYEQSRIASYADDWLNAYRPNLKVLTPAEHPFPVEHMVRFDTMYVETPRFMAELTADFLRAGGRIAIRRFATLAEIAELPEKLLFNCTGFGAAALVGDSELTAVRGQLAVLPPQHEVRYAFTGVAGYMFPRADGILLGGTFERGETDPTPQPADIARIVTRHSELFGSLRCAA